MDWYRFPFGSFCSTLLQFHYSILFPNFSSFFFLFALLPSCRLSLHVTHDHTHFCCRSTLVACELWDALNHPYFLDPLFPSSSSKYTRCTGVECLEPSFSVWEREKGRQQSCWMERQSLKNFSPSFYFSIPSAYFIQKNKTWKGPLLVLIPHPWDNTWRIKRKSKMRTEFLHILYKKRNSQTNSSPEKRQVLKNNTKRKSFPAALRCMLHMYMYLCSISSS